MHFFKKKKDKDEGNFKQHALEISLTQKRIAEEKRILNNCIANTDTKANIIHKLLKFPKTAGPFAAEGKEG